MKKQGITVMMVGGSERNVYGRNGVGRLGMFCFADGYDVITWRDGHENTFTVNRSREDPSCPFLITWRDSKERTGSGTLLTCTRTISSSILVTSEALSEWLQSRFFYAIDFEIRINGCIVPLGTCEKINATEIRLSNGQTITITRFKVPSGLSHVQGVQYRVHGRPVGAPTWKLRTMSLSPKKDGLTDTLITVDVDFLADSVEPDWSDFKKDSHVKQILDEAMGCVESTISDIVSKVKSNRKAVAVKSNIGDIRHMTLPEMRDLDSFLQSVVDSCPSLADAELSKILKALINMERSNSKYSLMERLSDISPDNIDELDEILSEWSIGEAKIVYAEISQRIKVLDQMDLLVNDKGTPEVQALQPIIGRNLWIFGPEFDSCAFSSNKTVTGLMRDLFHANVDPDSKRPDFVVLPESSIGIYCADSYDYEHSNGEARGYSKIVIIELKRGGFSIGLNEMHQALDYALRLHGTGRISGSPVYQCYVVGSRIKPGIGTIDNKPPGVPVVVQPIQYDDLIKAADARLLGIRRQLEQSFDVETGLENDVSQTVDKYPDIQGITGGRRARRRLHRVEVLCTGLLPWHPSDSIACIQP